MRVPRNHTLLAFMAAMVLLLASCGDDGDTTAGTDDDPSTGELPVDDGENNDGGNGAGEPETEPSEPESEAGDLEDSIGDMVENLEDQQAAQGGGSATLTIGDQEWTFSPVLCAFGEEMIGQEGAVFNLSAIQDGMQMYASVDGFGHSVSLDDITDFTNPSVSVSSQFGEEFITIDGKNISAETGFTDNTSDNFDTTAGTFTATCP